MNLEALDKAVSVFGSQAKLAEALGLEAMAVSHWKKRGLPPKRAIEIEEATNKAVLREELLPEFFSTSSA